MSHHLDAKFYFHILVVQVEEICSCLDRNHFYLLVLIGCVTHTIFFTMRSSSFDSWLLFRVGFFFLSVTLVATENHKDGDEQSDCICGPLLERPPVQDHLGVARWLVHSLHMGVLSTISTKKGPTTRSEAAPPHPFGNVYSFVDGPCQSSTGIPYFYVSPLDQSAVDATVNPRVSFTLTEAFLPATCRTFTEPAACSTVSQGDPENPVCARLVLSGNWVVLDPLANKDEYTMARDGLWQRHPVMADWPADHDWQIVRLDVDDLWFLDFYGGAYQLNVDEYFALPWPPVVAEKQ